ncbi:MAG: hypothetical protein DME04_01615 [Candidatus Rokuibacteriota bacterium]|nr:MAG: hypothetical protein DME04_01615 [Candidatus Rokubacteria bacterium]
MGPCLIGATGGSGTRVFARIVRRGGLFIGTNLNVSEDAVELGAYSDRWINTFAESRARSLPPPVGADMGRDLDAVLARHLAPLAGAPRPWGWKEPRCIYLLPFLHERFPAIRLLHVVRDGRDMAYSPNQNQLTMHGQTLLRPAEAAWPQPVRSAALWSRVNLLTADYGERRLAGRYLRVRFEDLCADPVLTIRRVLEFFELQGNAAEIARQEVTVPPSLGRWRAHDAETLTTLHWVAAEALARFGYAAECEPE